MRFRHFFAFASLLLLFAASCSHKEVEPRDDSVREYSLELTNDDYTATTVLEKIGDTQISQVLNQPAWVSEIKREEALLNGSMVLDVSVKSDPSLEDFREARLTIEMTNGATAVLTLSQRAGLPVGFNDGESPSVNKNFEECWWKENFIQLVTSVQTINDRPQAITEETPLPWNPSAPGLQQNLPDEELEQMMKHKENWLMAFNTTGIKTPSCVHLNYFGLYNINTATLRIFYYWPEELIPESGANDHLWYVRFKGSQAEHNSTQFAVPINHELKRGTDAYTIFEKKAGTYYTSALTSEMSPANNYVIVPKIGWWAFDLDLSAMRKDSFFDNYQQITIGMDLFDQQNIILNSLIKGGLDGTLTGNLDLSALLPKSTSHSGKIVPSITSSLSSFLTNKFVLDYFFGGGDAGGGGGAPAPGDGGAAAPALRGSKRVVSAGVGVAMVAAGCLVSLIGNLVKAYGDEDADKDAKKTLGQMDAKITYDLNATMTTEGLIKSPRSHKVPSVRIPIDYFQNIASQKTKSGYADLEIGKGFWNISNDPVVYIVKDAYWANKAQATYYSRTPISWYRSGQEKAEYDVSMSPQLLGMRLISFLDPTSIGDVILNESLFGHPSKMAVSVSYGVYPNSEPGYTDWFRQATTLEYTPLTISDSRKSDKVSTGNVPGASAAPFKVFKQPYNKDLFKVGIGNSYPDDIATRLSSQTMGGDIERRYYGNSLFFCNKNANYSTVDNVQYVADPQIFLPFNEERRVIADPDIPDMVVSVNITFLSKGPLEEEETWKTYTLRYVPKVQLIAAKDVKGIADKIVAKANGGLPSYMNYRTAPAHQDIVKAYSDAISSQLSK